MRRGTLITWLLVLGVPLWLSGRVVDTRPALALAVILAVVTFSAAVAGRPHPTDASPATLSRRPPRGRTPGDRTPD